MKKLANNGFGLVEGLLVVLVLLVLGFGTYYVISQNSDEDSSVTSNSQATSQNEQTTQNGIDTSSWLTFTSAYRNYSFKHPSSWVLGNEGEYDDGSSAMGICSTEREDGPSDSPNSPPTATNIYLCISFNTDGKLPSNTLEALYDTFTGVNGDQLRIVKTGAGTTDPRLYLTTDDTAMPYLDSGEQIFVEAIYNGGQSDYVAVAAEPNFASTYQDRQDYKEAIEILKSFNF